MENFGLDLLIIGAVCLAGVVCFKLAYWLGGPVWPRQFATALPAMPQFRLSSGEVGELANLGLIASILVILLVLTPDASIYGSLVANWPYALASLGAIAIMVAIYTVVAVRRVRQGSFRPGIDNTEANLRLLARGYHCYIGYGTAIALLIVAVFVITISQMLLDYDRFYLESLRVAALLREIGALRTTDPALLQGRFEVVFGAQRVAEGYILDQVNSLLMLLLCVMLAYSTIYGTSVRQVFAEEALYVLRIIVMVLLAICVIYGCFVFFTLHLSFVDKLLEEFGRYAGLMNLGPWQVTQRYHELVAELSRQRGIFGFIIALTTGRGGLILVAPLATYFVNGMLSSRRTEAKKAEADAR